MSGAFTLRARRVVLADGVRAACVVVADGRVAGVRPWDEAPAGVPLETLADDTALLPGVVDTHVHVNDPGRADWEGFAHATRAAAAGGITTLVDMPLNARPPTTSLDGLQAKLRAMRGALHVDVGAWGGAVPGNADALAGLAAGGVLGFKAFRSPSGVEEFANVDVSSLAAALAVMARLGLPLLLHAEDPAWLAVPDGDPRRHATWLASRPPAAEASAIDELAALAAVAHARVHVVHVASGAAVQRIVSARARGVAMTAETCPHYLTFAAGEIADGATEFKCAPPIREATEREALWEALRGGTLDLVASDHSPAPPALKSAGGDFLRAWGGIASLELSLRATWTEAAARGHSLERLVTWMAAAPASLAGLEGRKGSIAPGADADLVAFATDVRAEVDAHRLQQRHPVTPYHGRTLRGAVQATWLAGERVWDHERGFAPPCGRWLRRGGDGIARVDPAEAFS